MRDCPKCNKHTLDVTGKEVRFEGNFLFRCWTCGFECDLMEAEKNMYLSGAIVAPIKKEIVKIHINQLRNLLKDFYRNIKNISPPFMEEEYEEFGENYEIFLEKLRKLK